MIEAFRPLPISLEPSTKLLDWAVFDVEIEGKKSRHYVGVAWDGARVCSPIQSYDPKRRVGISRSGRAYRLVGTPAGSLRMDVAELWKVWKRLNRAKELCRVKRQTRVPTLH